MKDYSAQKVAAWEEHHRRFTCDHTITSVRTRQVRGGSFQYVEQCALCGDPTCSPMPKATAIARCKWREPRRVKDDRKRVAAYLRMLGIPADAKHRKAASK